MTAARWGEISRQILACALERPDRLVETDARVIAPGPERSLWRLLAERAREGLATDYLSLRHLADVERACGPIFLADLVELPVSQASFPRYVREAADLALRDAMRRALDAGEPSAHLAELLTAFGDPGDAGGVLPRFRSADEYLALGPVEVEWRWRGYLAARAVTLLSAPPKRGKSTLLWGLVEALRRGATTFLGRELSPGPVVVLTEEERAVVASRMTAGGGLSILDRQGAFPRRPWLDPPSEGFDSPALHFEASRAAIPALDRDAEPSVGMLHLPDA